MEIEKCQKRGQVSQEFTVLNEKPPDGYTRSRERLTRKPTTSRPDQTLRGQKFGKTCPMRRNAMTRKSGLSRNRSWTMPEDCVVSSSLILMMENSKTSWRMRVESCKCRCQPQSLANFNVRSTGKLVALTRIARQNTIALLRPTNQRGSAWKDLITRIMKIILQEKEWIHWVTTTLCTNLFLCLKLWKYQMQKQQWRK